MKLKLEKNIRTQKYAQTVRKHFCLTFSNNSQICSSNVGMFQSILTVQNTATQNSICNILQWRWGNWNKGRLEMLVSNFRTTSRTCYSIQYRWKCALPCKERKNILQICARKTALLTFSSRVQQTREHSILTCVKRPIIL